MIRAVLDTNTIVSGLGWGGAPGAVVDAALAGQFDIVTSAPLLEELRRVLAYPKLEAVIGEVAFGDIWIPLAAALCSPAHGCRHEHTPCSEGVWCAREDLNPRPSDP